MAQIEDIFINGFQADGSIPTIEGFAPVITWEYVSDIASIGQVSYEIEIGTDPTGHGTDHFSPDILIVNQDSTASVYEYDGHLLERGSSYYGQIRATDEEGKVTPWSRFWFVINRLPYASNYRLEPSNPNLFDSIDLLYTFHDPDNDPESGTKTRWYKNNIYQPAYDDLFTVPSSAMVPNDSWTARVIPSDGLEYGPVVETNAVTVSQSVVSVGSAAITPASPNVDDLLKVTYVFPTLEDPYTGVDYSVGTAVIAWYQNGTAVSNSNQTYIRLDTSVGDEVYVRVTLNVNGHPVARTQSVTKTILDSSWHVYDMMIDGLTDARNLINLTPVVSWSVYKSTSTPDERPNYMRLLVTKTQSLDGPVFDTGVIEYTKDSYHIEQSVLTRGQTYYVHVGASDSTTIDDDVYQTQKITTAGSSWSDNVSNSIGWTIESKFAVTPDKTSDNSTDPYNLGINIHDGTYFCSIKFNWRTVTFTSDTSVVYTYASSEPDLRTAKTFRICAKGTNLRVYMNNNLIIDAVGLLTNLSSLKYVEYGDINPKSVSESNYGTFEFVRFATDGAYGIDASLSDEHTFYFKKIAELSDGSVDYVFNNIVAWTPYDQQESSKLWQFNESSPEFLLKTVSRNYSPITCIAFDEDGNKYIGTANGVDVIFGDRNDSDSSYVTSEDGRTFPAANFDRISNVPSTFLSIVEPGTRSGWFTLDTRSRGASEYGVAEDPYGVILDNVVHYYSQRTHGHDWFDRVNNTTGWRVSFTLDMDHVEADDNIGDQSDHAGFAVYLNDGTKQETLYFYHDRVRLLDSNVYANLNNRLARDFIITGRNNSIYVYERLSNYPTSSYRMLIDGSGLFESDSTPAGNSHKPKVAIDSSGNYHAVWHDDGNRRCQILYSKHDSTGWSTTEIVTESTSFNMRNADVDIDSFGRVWVVYEDTSWGPPEIVVSVRDRAGWNPRTRITNSPSSKGKPAIAIDSYDNVHVAWEDNRNGHWEIFWAMWNRSQRAWSSSAQFGSDTSVCKNITEEPYSEAETDFRNPSLSVLHPNVWLACQAVDSGDNQSSIYVGFYDTGAGSWNARGSHRYDSSGEFAGIGQGILVSQEDTFYARPQIASSATYNNIVVVWEEETSATNQVWVSVLNQLGTMISGPTRSTSSSEASTNPDVGFVDENAIIVYQRGGSLWLRSYNASFGTFIGEIEVESASRWVSDHPCVPVITPASTLGSRDTFRLLFDYEILPASDSALDIQEVHQHRLIGEVVIAYSTSDPYLPAVATVLDRSTVSETESKELVFGDISENVGLLLYIKDVELYFGYDARPYSIASYNTTTVNTWLDNRTNDIFVDVFGNMIVASFAGLMYHNVATDVLTEIQGFSDKLVTSVAWGKGGVWYVGKTDGGSYSTDAGKSWTGILSSTVINSIDVDSQGRAVIGTIGDGIYVFNQGVQDAHYSQPFQNITTDNIRVVAVDDDDVIWAGTDEGLIRIGGAEDILSFDVNSGMQSSHVTDIAIISPYLRYIGTASGVEKMHGTRFSSLSVRTHAIKNNNVSALAWRENTNSLWVACLDTLHEIVFRDEAHEIVSDEIVQYSSTDLSTEASFDRSTYYVLDLDTFTALVPSGTTLELSQESSAVYINKNKVAFGYVIDQVGQAVAFACNLLVDDQVEVELSNKLTQIHDFNQTTIEEQVLGHKRTTIDKIDMTSQNQTLLLAGTDRSEIYLDGGTVSLPFTTILLDVDAPHGCLEKLETLSRTQIRFRVVAYDDLSGVDGYMISNYENFTSDGETPLTFSPISTIVTHDLGDTIDNTFDSLQFSGTVSIGGTTYTVGTGTCIEKWTDSETTDVYLYAGTSTPSIIYRYDRVEDEWTAIQILDEVDLNRQIHKMLNVDGVIYAVTGTDTAGGSSAIYKSIDGATFNRVESFAADHIYAVAAGPDGTVYFGTSDGKIYQYRDDLFSLLSQNLSDAVYSIAVFQNILIAGTGEQGRAYMINLETNDNLIIFDGPETHISEVHILSSGTSLADADLYCASGEYSVIYRADLESLDFVRSYSTFNKAMGRMKSLSNSLLTFTSSGSSSQTGSSTVAAVGTDIFKHKATSWEFLYQHPEQINDFVEFESTGVNGIWVISDNKVTKWTNEVTQKTIYLRLRDKAGNISALPTSSEECPDDSTTCCAAYSIDIADLQEFTNEARIVGVSEYGEVTYAYDSPTTKVFYSADEIDQEIGIYTSEILNGSNDLVSWQSVSWSSTEPSGTSVDVQIRYATSEDDIDTAEWSDDLVVNDSGFVTLEHVTAQYMQFRVRLTSTVRDVSPTLTSVVLRNLTSQASHFFTTNFVLPSKPVKGLLSANTYIPVTSDIVFGINTKDSTDFSEYQTIEVDRLFNVQDAQFGEALRIGAKLLSPSIPEIQPTYNPGDPYDSQSYLCTIQFTYTNDSGSSNDYHFRIQFYNDPLRTQLIHEFYSGNDQTGWSVGSGSTNVYPAGGTTIANGSSSSISFTPLDQVETNQKWYITVDAYDGTSFETVLDDRSFVCSSCNLQAEAGLTAEYYKTGLPSLTSIPDFAFYTPDYTVLEDRIEFPLKSTEWVTTKGTTLTGIEDNFAARIQGKLYAPEAGEYTFLVRSKDGFRLFIDNIEVLGNDALHDFSEMSDTTILTSGLHDIEVRYFGSSEDWGLELRWILPSASTSVIIPDERFFHVVPNEYCEDAYLPRIMNFGVIFECEDNQTVQINMT